MQIQGLLLLRSGLTLSDESWEVVEKKARARGEFRRRLPLPPSYGMLPLLHQPTFHLPITTNIPAKVTAQADEWFGPGARATQLSNIIYFFDSFEPHLQMYKQGHLGTWVHWVGTYIM